MAALMYADVPGYAALILRRTYADLSLPDAIMDRAASWLRETDAAWNEQKKTWLFPSGAKLVFGYMEHENDKYRYQGAAGQFFAFDELTQFTESQYLYPLSRIRKSVLSGVPLRLRSAGNPGGIGHEWVKQRFILNGNANGRPFIPARLEDNPHLDQESYRQGLAELDAVTRKQLEDGDWDVAPTGGLFDRAWFTPSTDPYTPAARVRAWDLAATQGGGDYTVGVRIARTESGTYVVEDVVRGQWAIGERDTLIRATADRDGRAVSIVLEEEGGSAGKSQTAGLTAKLAGFTVTGERPTGPKDVRARPFASQVAAGNVRYMPGGWNSAWIAELVAFPTGAHDDQVDATSAAFSAIVAQKTPFAWLRNDPKVQAEAARSAANRETDEERRTRRMASLGLT